MCDEYPEFFRTKTVKAALVHRCEECWHPIQRGERHHVTIAKWDGEVQTIRAHELCELLAAQLKPDDECRLYGALSETVGDMDLTPLQARWASSLLGRRVLSADEVFAGHYYPPSVGESHAPVFSP